MTFTNQAIMFGTLAVDGTSGALELAALTGSPGQCWDLWADNGNGGSGGIFLSPAGNHGLAVDWESLAVTTIWPSTSSSQNTWYQAAQSYNGVTYVPQMFLTGYGQNGGIVMLQPNGSGGLEMGPCLTTFALETPPPYTPPGPTPSPYVPSGYIYTWGDEFTAANLDTTKWWTRYAGDGGLQQNIPSNGELELFSESNNHVMTGSSVKLTAYPPVAPSNNYLSGMLRGKQVFNFGSLTTAFYIEVKMKVPNAQGAWPAFWFSAEPTASRNPPPWPPEADVAEFMINAANGDTSSMIGVNVQLNGQNPPNPWNSDNWSYGSDTPSGWTWSATGRTKWVTPTDYSQAFHIFAIHVVPGVAGSQTVNPITGQPTHMLYYYADGYNTFNSQYDFEVGADGTFPYYAELLLDLAVGGMGGGTPTPSEFPCAFEIEYVRVYLSQNDPNALVTSVVGQDLMPSSGG